MLTVVIDDSGEQRVTDFTYELLWRELKDIPKSELICLKDWEGYKGYGKNDYISFVEADCLVSSGYFTSQMGLFKKNEHSRSLAMLSSCTSVVNWANRFYSYKVDTNHRNIVTPTRNKASSSVYFVQVGYVPGSIIRMTALDRVLKKTDSIKELKGNLTRMSAELSLAFWREGESLRVGINPNATYLTTESYVNDLGDFNLNIDDLRKRFESEII